MDLNCINDIVTNNLAIEIDLNNSNSWNLNTGLTVNSLTKWSEAISDNINLIDFGLTGFDNGRTNEMWSGITITPNDTYFSMYRVGYNLVKNPTSGETSGVTVMTEYLPMSGITTGDTGNYFELTGGYLQGFFKLDGYNYELLPARYNNGITIETLIYLYPDSEGIFYMMGARAEDKYNPYFSGETEINDPVSQSTPSATIPPQESAPLPPIAVAPQPEASPTASGVVTSEDNHLEAIKEKEVVRNAFADYEKRLKTELEKIPQSANTTNNAIAFEITSDKKIAYKYLNENNLLVSNKSKKSIFPSTGWTTIAISFIPDEIIEDPDILHCYPQRKGKFTIFVNGRVLWTIDDYSEFFFKAFQNDREKQIGVPYSISWGGGSFGLKYSWHYDIQTYGLYTDEDQLYINQNFIVKDDSLNGNQVNDLSLSADSTTFKQVDNENLEYPATVMRVEKTGNTTGQTYYIEYSNPITALSNREYEVNLSLFPDGFFKLSDENNFIIENKVSIIIYGTEDIDILHEDQYIYPLTINQIEKLPNVKRHPFPDDQEYSYVYQGVSYYGVTGLPVYTDPNYYTFLGIDPEYPAYFTFYGINPATGEILNNGGAITGQDRWIPLKTKFKLKDNTGKQIIRIGILIETSDSFNLDQPLFVSDFTYTGADILSQDPRKDNLLIEQNFNSSFNGKIQKLRIYDRGLTSQEILHNTIIESKKNPNLNISVSKGGRIILK